MKQFMQRAYELVAEGWGPTGAGLRRRDARGGDKGKKKVHVTLQSVPKIPGQPLVGAMTSRPLSLAARRTYWRSVMLLSRSHPRCRLGRAAIAAACGNYSACGAKGK